MSNPSLSEAVEWRTPVWVPAVSSALDRAAAILPLNAKVLGIGYNTGMMSCYMAARYGWNIVGYDIYDSSRTKAEEVARHYGLEEMTDFRVCSPDETLSIQGEYDAVFFKSVLYHISDKGVYRNWLNWLNSVIRSGGVVIAVENGRGGMIDRFYRKSLKRSRWADFLLFDGWAEQEFKIIFRNVDIKYFGRFSQFFTPFPKACRLITSLENRFLPPGADHCFIASIVAQK
jgi:cyclopropane fatty-acyl-phospholipid synthase-like methyltransferase